MLSFIVQKYLYPKLYSFSKNFIVKMVNEFLLIISFY